MRHNNNIQPLMQINTPTIVLPKSSTKIENWLGNATPEKDKNLPEILFITSFPPRECGIATYSKDLITALKMKFGTSFEIKICALESGKVTYEYPDQVTSILDTSDQQSFSKTALFINQHKETKIVVIQHEFGFFKNEEKSFVQFLYELTKPIIVVFHTVLPHPDERLKLLVQNITNACGAIIVMTNHAAQLLITEYFIPKSKVSVIAHGTHLVPHLNKTSLKAKYHLTGKKVMTTFGLLSSGKSIETTLLAMPQILKQIPDAVFLIIGKTHPEVVKNENEKYRQQLHNIVNELKINDHVRFINEYLELPKLLEYLQLTDIYLFTTNDPNQAVSGTFVYAMSCGRPIISTPIPHAKEVLNEDTGIIIDFQNSEQLAEGVIVLLNNDDLRKNISTNILQKIVFTAWENSAVEHASLLKKQIGNKLKIKYLIPEIKLDHLEKMTTDIGIIQFCKINQPDFSTGYTLDDNVRALIAMCMHFEITGELDDLHPIYTYLNFIQQCIQPGGNFLNYMDINESFTEQNYETNLDDANGRAIWALGFLISKKSILSDEIISTAISIFEQTLPHVETIHSTRALAFIIKGFST
ncbi:MAG: glycosyltransferase [Paludibacter sp.]